jgi:hypothetical protein
MSLPKPPFPGLQSPITIARWGGSVQQRLSAAVAQLLCLMLMGWQINFIR